MIFVLNEEIYLLIIISDNQATLTFSFITSKANKIKNLTQHTGKFSAVSLVSFFF